MPSKQDVDFFRSHFFIIDSDNFSEIGSNFSGFAYFNDLFIVNYPEFCELVKYGDYGKYIKIDDNGAYLTIETDYYGLASLFLYQDGCWFAVSNSLLYLVNYLKRKRKKLTVNKTTALSLPFTWTSLEYKKTIFNEISHISCLEKIKIDKINNTIYIVRQDHVRDKYDIDSDKGIHLIDTWRAKWHALICALVQNHYDLRISISG